MGLNRCRAVRLPILTPVHCPKCQQWASEHRNWTPAQWKKIGLIWWITLSRGWLGVCCLLCWRKASWPMQCDALGDVQLGNLHHCGCYFSSYRLAKLFCRPCAPFHRNNIQLDNATCQKAKVFRKLWGAQRGVDLDSRFSSIHSSISGMCWTNKSTGAPPHSL